MTPTPAFAQTIEVGAAKIVTADASTLKTIYTAGVDGTLIDSILVSSDDTSYRDLQLWTTIGGVDFLLYTVTIPANSGFTSGVPIMSLLENARAGSSVFPFGWYVIDANGNKLLRLKALEILKAKVLTTVTAAKTIYIRASGTGM
jgi:hypothetical protein